MTKRAGRKSKAQTPAPRKERIYGSKKNPKGSAASEKSASKIKLDEKTMTALKNKLKEFKEKHPNKKNITLNDLKAVYRRGAGAYSKSHRPTITGGAPNSRNAWSMARVNKFLKKAGGAKVKAAYVQDDDLMKMEGGGSTLLAPNGEPSNLNSEQWHLVRTPQFKAWFGDWENDPQNASKVVDENREPLVVYHGTKDNFTIFDLDKVGKKTDTGMWGKGFYFSSNKKYSETYANKSYDYKTQKKLSTDGYIFDVFLSLKNPYIINNQNDIPKINVPNEKMEDLINADKLYSQKFRKTLIDKGYDGVFVKFEFNFSGNYPRDYELVAFEPNQIKLANGSNKTFDSNSNDIRYEEGGEIKLYEYKDEDEHKITFHFVSNNRGVGKLILTNDPLYDLGFDNVFEIRLLYVDKDYRGEGIAKQLIKSAIKWAKDNNVDWLISLIHVRSDSSLTNKQMFGFLKRYGFEYIDTKYNSDILGLRIKEVYDKGGFIAPNGKPTNLTAEQYKLVRTPQFKAWFGDWENDPQNASKVVDENGEPLVVYRSVSPKPLAQGYNPPPGSWNYSREGYQYFAKNKDYSRLHGHITKEFFLNIRNILDFNYYNEILIANGIIGYGRSEGIFTISDELENEKPYLAQIGRVVNKLPELAKEIRSELKTADGFHGYEAGGYGEEESYVVRKPEQIKLADGTNTTFDPNLPDSRFAKGGSTSLAPNGEPSNLNSEQWHLVRTPQFKAWFGDWENDPENASKVVDENGEPKVMWHYSPNEFTVFNPNADSRWNPLYQRKENVVWFGGSNKVISYSEGEKGHLYKCFLNVKKPIIVDAKNYDVSDYYKDENGNKNYSIQRIKGQFISRLSEVHWSGKKNDNDGVIFQNAWDNVPLGLVVAVLNSNQIKLADGSNTTFDSESDDIRYAEGGKTFNDKELLAKRKRGESIGFTATAHLKAKGLIPRSDGTKRKSPQYKKEGGLVGGYEDLTDEWLSKKIEIFLDKVKPIKYYFVDPNTNTLTVGFDKYYSQDAAQKVYEEATSSKEFFHAPSVESTYDSKTGDLVFKIKLKKAVEYSKGGSIVYSAIFFDENEIVKRYGQVHPNLYSHHSTIEFKPQSIGDLPIGDRVNISIVGRLTTDKVDVLLVNNPLSKNKYPHITLSTSEGVKPFESNKEIEQNIDKVEPLNDYLEGVVGYFDGSGDITKYNDGGEVYEDDEYYEKTDWQREQEMLDNSLVDLILHDENYALNLNDRYILSHEKNIEFRNKEQDNERDYKPRGLWYAFNYEWASWVYHEMPRYARDYDYVHKIEVTDKVLKLDTIDKCIEFTKKYGIEQPWGYNSIYKIDWIKVAKDYSGIEVTQPYKWSRIHEHEYTLWWLYGWDVGSGCVWNEDGVKSIELVHSYYAKGGDIEFEYYQLEGYLRNIRIDPTWGDWGKLYRADFGENGVISWEITQSYFDEDAAKSGYDPNNPEFVIVQSMDRDRYSNTKQGIEGSKGEGAKAIASLFLKYSNLKEILYDDYSEGFWQKIGGIGDVLKREDFFKYFNQKNKTNYFDKGGDIEFEYLREAEREEVEDFFDGEPNEIARWTEGKGRGITPHAIYNLGTVYLLERDDYGFDTYESIKYYFVSINESFAKGGEVDEEVIKERWAKKKDSLMNMADNIRSLRTNLRKDLKGDDDKDRLTALAISIMDKTAERVGNDESEANGHLGITGLSKRNVKVEGNTITLKYIGKSGVKQEKQFSDEGIASALKDAIANSQSKYVFETSDGFRIKNDRINRYLGEYDISAKDLRGYSANQWIVSKLREVNDKEILGDEANRKKKFNEIVKSVAEKVGHGAPTLKKHYMLPSLEREWVNNGKIVDLANIKRAFEDGGEINYARGGSPRIRMSEANEIKEYIKKQHEQGKSASWGGGNRGYQYVARPDGVFLSYDIVRNKYKFFHDIDSFVRALYRLQVRGYKKGGDVGVANINQGTSVINNIDYDHLDESQDIPNDGEGVFDKGGALDFNDIVLYHEKKGNWFVAKNTVYAWLYQDPNAAKKLESGEFEFVLFPPNPPMGVAMRSGYVPPLLKIWTKKYQKETKGADNLLGIVKGWYDEENKKLYIIMMTTRKDMRRKGVNSHIIKNLREEFKLDKDQIIFDKPTKEGEMFSKSGKYNHGGEVDLFEHYDELPQKVQAILEKYENEEPDYTTLESLQGELEEHGYTFDYGLDYEPYNLRKMAKGGEISDEDKKETYKKWKSLVNMSKSELEKFYNSEEGKVAGLTASQAKSQGIDSGRESARWIMKMKDTSVKNWTPTMWKWAKKQISFISRMSGNKGKLYDESGAKTRKHTSLLIWGHNPTKKAGGGELDIPIKENAMNEVTYNQLPAINDLGVGKKFVLKEHYYNNHNGKPTHQGCRYLVVENMGDAQMSDCLKLKVHHCYGGGGVTTMGIITRPIKNIMNKGRDMGESLASGVEKAFKRGGELDPDKKEIKEYFEHKSGAAGGLLVGKRHSEGGIQAINKSTGQPLEMEGGEVVITRDAVSDSTLHDFNGKQMTNREILSAINESGGGVKFAEGGDVSCLCSGKEYKLGGKTYKDYELFKKINNSYGSKSAIEKGMKVEDKEHGETFRMLKNGEITYEQFLKKLVVDHLSENPKYYDK